MLRACVVSVIACCVVVGCGSTAMIASSDGAAHDGSLGSDAKHPSDAGAPEAGSAGDGPVPVCADVPYPMTLMCSVPMETCLPTSGYDCCRCLPGHGCSAAYVWRCQNSYVGCPTSPPTLGTACTLPSNVDCIYCTSSAIDVACNAGQWSTVAAEVFCQ
jgi:hypothetical protein